MGTAQPLATGGFYQPDYQVPHPSQHGGAPQPYPNQATGDLPQQSYSQAYPQGHQAAVEHDSSLHPEDPSAAAPEDHGARSAAAENIPTYWSPGAAAAPPRYSPLSVTIFQPKPCRPVILSRISSILSPQPASEGSASSPRSPTAHRQATVAVSPTDQRPALIPTSQSPRAGPSHRRANAATSPRQSTILIPLSSRPKPIVLSICGHHRTASSQDPTEQPGTSTMQPVNMSAAHHAPQFSLIPVEEAKGNPVYEVESPYSASISDFANWLAIPLLRRSVQATTTDPVMNEVLERNAIRHSLGWQLVMMMILYYRAFYLQMLAIPSASFPPLLSKDDVIDCGLVLIVSSWIINLLAMHISAGRTPTGASVGHFVDMCLNSLEVTVLLSIAGQIDLTIHSMQDIEEKGWLGLFTSIPLEYYTRRVADPVKHKVLEFHLEGCLGIYAVYLQNMRTPRIIPNIAYKRGTDYATVKSAIKSSLTGNNIHLILKDPSSQKYIHDHEKHGTYTVQDGSDIAEDTIDIVHANVREGVPVPPDTIHLFRNINIDSGAAHIIGHFAKAAPLALSRTLTGKNPYINASDAVSRQMPFIGLLPYIVGHIEAAYSSLRQFGSETTPEKIVASAKLEDAYEKKGECMGVWLTEACLGRTTESNLPDLEWVNESIRLKFADALRSLDGTREFWHVGRSELLVWDPYVPWSGKFQDFLAYYVHIGSTPAATEEGEVFEGKFVRSPLTDIYDEIAREHEKGRADREKSISKAKEELQHETLGDDSESEESIGAELIFRMAHITKETAGDAWPMIQEGLAHARRMMASDKKELDRLLNPSPLQPPS